jgi:hypothetical protein
MSTYNLISGQESPIPMRFIVFHMTLADYSLGLESRSLLRVLTAAIEWCPMVLLMVYVHLTVQSLLVSRVWVETN